jgi:hypothetical protein
MRKDTGERIADPLESGSASISSWPLFKTFVAGLPVVRIEGEHFVVTEQANREIVESIEVATKEKRC